MVRVLSALNHRWDTSTWTSCCKAMQCRWRERWERMRLPAPRSLWSTASVTLRPKVVFRPKVVLRDASDLRCTAANLGVKASRDGRNVTTALGSLDKIGPACPLLRTAGRRASEGTAALRDRRARGTGSRTGAARFRASASRSTDSSSSSSLPLGRQLNRATGDMAKPGPAEDAPGRGSSSAAGSEVRYLPVLYRVAAAASASVACGLRLGRAPSA